MLARYKFERIYNMFDSNIWLNMSIISVSAIHLLNGVLSLHSGGDSTAHHGAGKLSQTSGFISWFEYDQYLVLRVQGYV